MLKKILHLKNNEDSAFYDAIQNYSDSQWKRMYYAMEEDAEKLKHQNSKLSGYVHQLEHRLKNAEEKAGIAEAHYNNKKKELSHQYEKALDELDGQCSLCKSKYKEEIEDIVNLNKALLRVSIEKANSERNIPYKKMHDGYLVLSGIEAGEKTYDEVTLDEYRYKIQSPYRASIPFKSVHRQISIDLKYGSLLHDVGCIGIDENVQDSSVCVLYRWNLIMNTKSGFYEFDAFFTQPIEIPANRLPPPQ